MQDDWFPLLELLSMIFNPTNKFHVFNSSRCVVLQIFFHVSGSGFILVGWIRILYRYAKK
jgi:hypothetical protein